MLPVTTYRLSFGLLPEDLLEQIHSRLGSRVGTYLEIGVAEGRTLAHSRAQVGADWWVLSAEW